MSEMDFGHSGPCTHSLLELDPLPAEWIDQSAAPRRPRRQDDRFPLWMAALFLVIYCSVFWVGLLTVVRWALV